MTKLYLLVGTCGEYSDFQEWIVRGYTSNEAAAHDVARLNGLAEETEWVFDRSEAFAEAAVARLKAHDLQSPVNIYCSRIHYRVEEVDVVTAPQIFS